MTGPGGSRGRDGFGRPMGGLPALLLRPRSVVATVRQTLPMTEDPDFRSDKSESTEGGRVAVARWAGFHHNLDEDVIAQAFSTPAQRMEDLDPEIRDDIAAEALERSELIGFWVAWHLAGGFDNLERGGWHRATIFRKVRRFRATYGTHPDNSSSPGYSSTSETAWSEQHRPAGSGQPTNAASSS